MDVSLLKQAAVFHDLDEGALARVAEICREQTFASGTPIFKEGEPGNRLFLISQGEVRISRNIPGSGEEALAVLKPGACFGEMSVFDPVADKLFMLSAFLSVWLVRRGHHPRNACRPAR